MPLTSAGQVYAYSPDQGHAVGAFDAHEDAVCCATLAPPPPGGGGRPSRLFTASWDCTVKARRGVMGRGQGAGVLLPPYALLLKWLWRQALAPPPPAPPAQVWTLAEGRCPWASGVVVPEVELAAESGLWALAAGHEGSHAVATGGRACDGPPTPAPACVGLPVQRAHTPSPIYHTYAPPHNPLPWHTTTCSPARPHVLAQARMRAWSRCGTCGREGPRGRRAAAGDRVGGVAGVVRGAGPRGGLLPFVSPCPFVPSPPAPPLPGRPTRRPLSLPPQALALSSPPSLIAHVPSMRAFHPCPAPPPFPPAGACGGRLRGRRGAHALRPVCGGRSCGRRAVAAGHPGGGRAAGARGHGG
jgi:hypothetical protein